MFATKWELLFAQVLIGVDRSTGVWSGSEPTPGQQMVCVWTSEEIATQALHVESWELRLIEVRELLALLPAGIGIIVDPETPTGMTASASYVANLKTLLEPFPPEAAVRITSWDELPAKDIAAAASRHESVQQLHALIHTIDDSPELGALVYSLVPGADATEVVADLEATLDQLAPDVTALGVAAARILALSQLPDEIQSALPPGYIVYRRKRSWLRRR